MLAATLAPHGFSINPALASVAGAPEAAPAIEQFHRDQWTREAGVPFDTRTIGQTPDGYIWLGSADGLVRFDGVSFEKIPYEGKQAKLNPSITSMLVDKHGRVWIGLGQGAGVAYYDHGRLIDAEMPDAPRQITHILQGPGEDLFFNWGGESHRLWRWNDRGWSDIDVVSQLPPGSSYGFMSTRDGVLWAALLAADENTTQLTRLVPRARYFEKLQTFPGGVSIFRDSRDGLWRSDRQGIQKFDLTGNPGGTKEPAIAIPDDDALRKAIFDTRGGIWSGSKSGKAFYRAGPLGALTQLGQEPSRINLNPVGDAFLDKEGSIWIANLDGGLARYRLNMVTMNGVIPRDYQKGVQMYVAKDGVAYAESLGKVYRIKPNEGPALIATLSGNSALICAAHDQGLWVIDHKTLSHLNAGGSLTKISQLPGEPANCVSDSSGRLWLQGADGRVWWQDHKGWQHLAGADTSTSGGVLGMPVNSSGAFAFAVARGQVVTVTGKRMRRFDLGRIGLDNVTRLLPFSRGFLAVGNGRIAWLRDGLATSVDFSPFQWLGKVSAGVEGSNGETWLYTWNVISRVATRDLENLFVHSAADVPRRVFDEGDGLVGTPMRVGTLGPALVKGGDGRIWIRTSGGLATIDPHSLNATGEAVHVRIRSLAASGAVFRDPVGVDLLSGTTSVDLAFAAMGLSRPDRVAVRYRLNELEPDWLDAGSRRSIRYSNLGPGTYHFSVTAANENGVWDTKGAVVEFRIAPTFVQSWPFKLLCAFGLVALLWLAHRLRVRVISAQIRARLSERHDERERIARELHDTLLQSIQALMLRFRFTADGLSQDPATKKALEDALDQAEVVIAEGRDRVRDLRETSSSDTLEGMLAEIISRQGITATTEVSLVRVGDVIPLSASAMKEVCAIATEALFNVKRHARATRLRITMTYRPDLFTLAIRDNGVGLPADVVREGRRPGHYGLVSMRERTRKLGGEMIFDAAPGGGTDITLIVPKRSAFEADDGLLQRSRTVWRDFVTFLHRTFGRNG